VANATSSLEDRCPEPLARATACRYCQRQRACTNGGSRLETEGSPWALSRGCARGIIAALSAALLALTGAGLASIPAAAAPGYEISGTVILPEEANPAWMETVYVEAYDEATGYGADLDLATGDYTISVPAPGTYWVVTWLDDYYDPELDEWVTTGLVPVEVAVEVGESGAPNTNLVLEQGRIISGTVTLAPGADASLLDQGIVAFAESTDDDLATYASADVDPDTGDYAISGLPAGEYVVGFEGLTVWDGTTQVSTTTNIVSEFYDDADSWEDATRIDVTAGDAAGIDAELAEGRTLSGTVTLPAGTPAIAMQAVNVFVGELDGERNAMAQVAPDGAYTVTGLTAGDYMVEFAVWEYYDESTETYVRPNVLGEFWNNASSPWDADPVTIGASNVTGINASLAVGRTISGTVTLEPGADPTLLEQGVEVFAEPVDGDTWVNGWATVDPATGDYLLAGLAPGAYTVQFAGAASWDDETGQDVITNVVTEYWDDALVWDDATPVSVAGSSATGIDAELAEGLTISGTVSVGEGGDPESLAGVSVEVADDRVSMGAMVDPATGEYTVAGLPDGEFTVRFLVDGYYDEETDTWVSVNLLSEYYDDSLTLEGATPVTLAGASATGIDAELAVGRTISGTVTVPAEAHPDEELYAFAWTLDGEPAALVYVESGEPYTLVALPPGEYVVEFGSDGYWDDDAEMWVTWGIQGEFYDDVLTIDEATPVSVSDADATGIDADLALREGVVLTDIDSSAFVDEITWLANSGITTGYPNGDGTAEFRPLGNVTRDAMAAFLYRFAGSPTWEAPEESPFVDVTPATPFYHEITWLADQGITTGWSTTKGQEFRPRNKITRDAMAAFLFRFDGSPEWWEAPEESPFVDVTPATPFYSEVTWLAEMGISTGWTTSAGQQFRPLDFIKRDAMAAFLFRYNFAGGGIG